MLYQEQNHFTSTVISPRGLPQASPEENSSHQAFLPFSYIVNTFPKQISLVYSVPSLRKNKFTCTILQVIFFFSS